MIYVGQDFLCTENSRESVPCVGNLNLPPLEQETESAVNGHLIGCFGNNWHNHKTVFFVTANQNAYFMAGKFE